MAFLDYLLKRGVITDDTSKKIARQAKESNKDTFNLLEESGIDRENLLNLKADYFQVPFKKVDPVEIPSEVFKYILEESAVHYQFVPIGLEDGILEVGVVDPDNLEARDALQFISSKINLPFKVYLISRENFETVLENYKSISGEAHEALSELDTDVIQGKKETQKKGDIPIKNARGITRIVEETPITKLVSVIFRHAVEGHASDIHIEHTGSKVRVRFRVDGVLHTSLFLPISVHAGVIARIKVLSNLKLDEKRKPQDGSFSATIEGRKIDMRVSTFPAYYGEKIVMRILDPEKGIKKLEETGFSKEHLLVVREALKRPYGLILLTGPTGSGKTTTLYAMLNELDSEKKNIVSLEDPVEYNIEGVSQSQVRPEIKYTFASGLRSIVRQDPDIIMVGEIRDHETANLAVQAALTGHLVFSTLHTNNAIGVVPRLIDMGIEPYLIALTLILAIAQRLTPILCESSKKPIPIDAVRREEIEKQFEGLSAEVRKNISIPKEVYEAVPSNECPSGTRGRIGVFEILEINKEIEKLILEKTTEAEFMRIARAGGMITMKEDALLKSFASVIPFRAVSQFE